MSEITYCHTDIIKQITPKNVLVIGDFMLDVYTVGHVRRISPEAPVPVLCVTREHHLAGGAGNAVLNLISMGMNVRILGRVGADASGRELIEQLRKEGVDTSYLLIEDGFITPQKKRMMADNHQLLRVDYEHPTNLSSTYVEHIIAQLPNILNGIDIVAISDYAKGFLTPHLLQAVIHAAKVPVLVDPKGKDFTRYRGATVLKPNQSEAFAAVGLGHEASLDEVANKILKEVEVDTLVVTRSQEGISVFSSNHTRIDYPARVQEVRDVTGAGDTVLAVMTAILANGFSLQEAVEYANRAAAIAVARVGCARISLADFATHSYC